MGAFGINLNVSYNDDYNTDANRSLFEAHIVGDNFQKTSSLSLEIYQVAPIFYEYGDDLKIQDLDRCDVAESNQHIHEGIHFIVHEQLETIYDNYTSNGSMEEENHVVNSQDDIVVDTIEGTCEHIQDKFDAFYFQFLENIHSLFSAEQMKYHFISGSEQQCDFLY